MSTFTTRVFRSLQTFAQLHSFIPSYEASNRGFASLVRRESENVCSYVFVRNELPSGAAYRVDYWIAPIEFPDDSLDALGIGYKTRIGETFTDDAVFLQLATEKVSRLLPLIPSFCIIVEEELKKPIFTTKVLANYHLETQAYRALFSETSPFVNERVSVQRMASAVVQRKARYKDLETSCIGIMSELFTQTETLFELQNAYFDGDAQFAGVVLAKRVYMEALVPVNKGVSLL